MNNGRMRAKDPVQIGDRLITLYLWVCVCGDPICEVHLTPGSVLRYKCIKKNCQRELFWIEPLIK